MRIACVGGGPAGLYFSILAKLWDPASDVTVYERNKEGATHGWGVTMEHKFLAKLATLDLTSAEAITRASIRWRDQVVSYRGGQDVNRANGDAYGVSRQRMLDILSARAAWLGVDIRYEHEVRDVASLPDADLIVAADGVNSKLRSWQPGFGTSIRQGRNKYTWLGTSKVFDTFTFCFEETSAGWIWAYGYQHEPGVSTFIVECSPDTWAGLGFSRGPATMALGRLEQIFARHLDGHRLSAHFPDGTDARWLNFRTVQNERWHQGRLVLIGDSAHTAHFSVGLGTTLAIEDSIALVRQLGRSSCLVPGRTTRGMLPTGCLATPLQAYQEERQAALRSHGTDAMRSATWFENVPRYAGLGPAQFATMLHSRRAPLLPVLPPALFWQLQQARRRFAALDALRSLASR